MIRTILISLLTLGMSACGASRPIKYYTVQTPSAPALPAVSDNAHKVSLLVASVAGAQIFQDTPIAYRVGTNEIGTYQYSRWAEPPVEMLKGKLIHLLSTSGDYQSVAPVGSTSEGQFVVRGRLYAFEEVDSGGIAGRVSMEFELCERKSGKVVWSHLYSQSEPVDGKKIPAVVNAIDLSLDRGLKEVAAGINQYFSSEVAQK
jgi:ABC-type uncharacterized transport system auxiliary subunit